MRAMSRHRHTNSPLHNRIKLVQLRTNDTKVLVGVLREVLENPRYADADVGDLVLALKEYEALQSEIARLTKRLRERQAQASAPQGSTSSKSR